MQAIKNKNVTEMSKDVSRYYLNNSVGVAAAVNREILHDKLPQFRLLSLEYSMVVQNFHQNSSYNTKMLI